MGSVPRGRSSPSGALAIPGTPWQLQYNSPQREKAGFVSETFQV